MSKPGLLRVVGRWDLTAAVVNGVIGSAIFGLPSRVAALTGLWSPVAYLVTGVAVLGIALCFAEVASRFDEPGGPYLYVRESLGRFVGFEAGWLFFCARVMTASAVLNVFATYLAEFVPAARAGFGRGVAMLGMLALATLPNLRGVRQATWSVNAFTIARLLPLALLLPAGVAHVRSEVLASQAVAASDWPHAILLLVFAYVGFEAPLIPASELRDPRRDTAFALLVGLGVVASVYMLVQVTVIGSVPHAAASQAPLADAFRAVLGQPGAALAGLAALISCFGWCLGSLLQSPRLLYAMAERGELPAVFGRVHECFRTPYVAILTYAAAAGALALYGGFEWNASVGTVARLVTLGLTCVALPVLRRTRPEAPGFRLPAAGVIVPAALGFCLWLLLTRSFEQAWILALLVSCGAALFLAARRV
jgi:amino acid transporter